MSAQHLHEEEQDDFSFKKLFVPLTTLKAIHVIVILGFIVFGNMLFNGFVWDDDFQIVHNASVQNGHYFHYFTNTIGPYYRPLMLASYTFMYQLFHLNAFFYHFIQLTIHIVNAFLIFSLLRYFSKKNLPSLILALLFLIHPMNVEPVAYIANLQDVMFVFFGLTALYIFIKQKFGSYAYAISALLLFLSLLSKETGILFVLLCSAYVVIFKRTKRLAAIALYALTVLFYFLFRWLSVGLIKPEFNIITPNTIAEATVLEKFLTVPKTVYFYIATFVFPTDLAGQYWYVTAINFSDFIFPLVIDCLVLGILFFIYFYFLKGKEQAKSFLFFLCWFLIGVIFHLHLFPLDKTASTRWFYFPMIGLIGMIAVSLASIKRKLSSRQKTIFILLIIFILSSFSVRTMVRNTNWHSGLTLFAHDIVSREDNADMRYNYGTYLLQAGRYEEAKVHLEKATQLVSNYFLSWHNLGITYLRMNKLTEAQRCFEKSIKVKKDALISYRSFIYTLILQKNYDEAKKTVTFALQMWPNDATLWRLSGLISYHIEDTKEAEANFQKSLYLSPDPITQYYLNQLTQKLEIEMRE